MIKIIRNILLIAISIYAFNVHSDNSTSRIDWDKLEKSNNSDLFSIKSLKCTLGKGSVGLWKSGSLKIEADNWNTTIYYDSIDIESGSARIIGNQGSGNAVVLTTGIGITFIEKTGIGNLTFTTVFNSKNKSGQFYAVSSRHIDSLGDLLPSQYHGTCDAWE